MKGKGLIFALIGLVITCVGVGFSLFSENSESSLWLTLSSGIGWALILIGAFIHFRSKKSTKTE